MDRGVFGNRLGSRFRLNHAPFVITVRTLRKPPLAVTEIVNDNPDLCKTLPIPPEDAFLVHLMMRDGVVHETYVDNKSVAPSYDLTRGPIAKMHCSTACLSFYLPRAALEELADSAGDGRVLALEFRHGRAYDDPVKRNHSTRPSARGGLAPWQVRRVRDILSNNLDGEPPLAKVACECGLSASHFARAFRQSFGIAPHQWLLKVRVERAKERLLNSDASLAETAIECGFADQSHFTRVFKKNSGVSPGQWRRQFASGAVPAANDVEERNHSLH